MGRPAEGLRRQGLASCADIPCLTPPHLSHYVFVPFWHLTTFLVTYIHSLSPLWPRNARRRDNGRTRFGNRAAPRLSRRAGRPKPRHAKNGARPALCGRDEVREGHLSSFIVLKKRRRKKTPLRRSSPRFLRRGSTCPCPLRPRPALPRQGSASGHNPLGLEIAARGHSGRCNRAVNRALVFLRRLVPYVFGRIHTFITDSSGPSAILHHATRDCRHRGGDDDPSTAMLDGHRFQAASPARQVEQALGWRSEGRTKPPTGPSAGADGARNGCEPGGVGARVGVCRRRQDSGHGAGHQLVGAKPGRPAKCTSDEQSGQRSFTSGKCSNGGALEQHALANTQRRPLPSQSWLPPLPSWLLRVRPL